MIHFFRQPFKHLVILAAAGTSLDNGSNKGETRNGLWKSGRDIIKQLYKELLPCDNKLRRIAKDKDIEAFLSHILLVEISEEKASQLKPLREQLEKIIRNACLLELDSSNAPHKTFLYKPKSVIRKNFLSFSNDRSGLILIPMFGPREGW